MANVLLDNIKSSQMSHFCIEQIFNGSDGVPGCYL